MAEFKKVAEVAEVSELSSGRKEITIEENIITCPYHGSRFDVTNGQVVKGPAKEGLPIYEVKVEGKDILIST